MKTWILPLVLLMFVVRAYASTPEALAILDRHIEVAGGRSVHQNLKSMARSGQIDFFNPPKTYSYNTSLIYPDKLREELKNPSEILVSRGTDGKNFWSWNGKSYAPVEDADLIKQMKDTALTANRDLLWAEAELGSLKIVATPSWAKGSKCLKGDKSEKLICFDIESGFLSAKGSDQEYRLFSKWTKAGPLALPFSLVHYQNGQKMYDVELSSARENQKIDLNLFKQPTAK